MTISQFLLLEESYRSDRLLLGRVRTLGLAFVTIVSHRLNTICSHMLPHASCWIDALEIQDSSVVGGHRVDSVGRRLFLLVSPVDALPNARCGCFVSNRSTMHQRNGSHMVSRRVHPSF